MYDTLLEASRSYAARRRVTLAERLGSGIDGSVWVLRGEVNPYDTAVKIHRGPAAFWREVRCYERLREEGILHLRGFVVPRLLRIDADLLAIEMTVVSPPFLLDFASAHLNEPPDFSEEVWEDWRTQKEEQFGERWGTVEALLDALKMLGIHLLDPSPSNIQFD